MKLNESSIKWAINHLFRYSDTDLFPKPAEFDIINSLGQEAIDLIKEIDVGNSEIGAARRFIVPKEELSYRTATQLDPLDNILLTAIVYEFGNLIEQKRIPASEKKVFSYRFDPTVDYALYNYDISWLQFWDECKIRANGNKYIVTLDIADFYNQIYHHVIENQMIVCGVPNQIKKWVLALFEKVTAKVSRGIPIGPHATHIFSEMSLIPVDNSLSIKGYNFCRFVDDYIFFCNDYDEAKSIVYNMASILDKQQRLILQKQKTKIWEYDEFIKHCDEMIQDRPINQHEREIIDIIRRHSGGSPYLSIDTRNLTNDELKYFNDDIVEKIIEDYLKGNDPNYTRLRWFIRRLSQVGVSCAVKYFINNLEKLTPAISDICHYFISVKDTYSGDWKDLGAKILELLKNPVILSNEYFQLTLLSLFWRNISLNHLHTLIQIYPHSSNEIKRKILLAAHESNAADWIRELKESYGNFDPWSKRAFFVSIHSLPIEERKFFITNMVHSTSVLEDLMIKWAKKNIP